MTRIRAVRWILMVMMVMTLLATSRASFAQVSLGVSVSFGPPAIPIYAQPVIPVEGYLWVPGYWAYAEDGGYYWVPGTWVLPPQPGFLWTPGYWGWGGSGFFFHVGYWGPQVGFYGGINYGFGYFGDGYQGGRWDNGRFFYNRSINNINTTIVHNVYNTTIINNNNGNRVSYNGGEGGINARPTPEQEAAANEKHVEAVPAQTEHEQAARGNPQQFASANHGKPPVAATPTPGSLNGRGVVQAKQAGAPYNPPAMHGPANKVPPPDVKDLPPAERPAAPNTGNPNLDKKYQQQQNKMYQQQQQERQKLQQQQEQEHQKMAKQSANSAQVQQMEQKHQQQTQQLQQKHVQQQQQMQQKVQKENPNGGKPPRS